MEVPPPRRGRNLIWNRHYLYNTNISCHIKVTLLQLLTSWPPSRDYWKYECHPIVCLHDIDSALEMIASDFRASRQPSELFKLIKYFTILCLTNWNVQLKKKEKKKTFTGWKFGNLFGLKCQQRLLTNSPKANTSRRYLHWREFRLKWDFQEPLKTRIRFLLASGYIFQVQWQIAKIKIIVRILSAQLKLINLSSSKNLAWFGPNACHKTFDFLTGKLYEFDLETWHGK